MYDHEQNLPYDVILSKIEVRSLLYDMYNFYKMQVNNAVALTYRASMGNSCTYSSYPKFWTDRSRQMVQIQIKLEEQSDQGRHCLMSLFHGRTSQFKF